MNDLRELYQEVILDHNKNPRNKGSLDDATNQAEGFNPLCGDKVSLFLIVENGEVKDVSFEGAGCAISTASASLMTEAVKGKSVEEAHRIFSDFHKMVAGDTHIDWPEDLASLEALAGVKEFPVRVKCATLAWHTLEAALKGEQKTSTE
jgi:nitrogen fixation protein NifU and related proteins